MREFSLSPLLWRGYSSPPAGRWAGSCRFPRARRAALEARIGGGLILACAFAIAGLAFLEMRRAKTTFHPGGKANALVRGGVFERTRNPMYLALTLVTLGLGVATANPWLVLLAPALLLYLQERVVKREEAYLTERFGAAVYRLHAQGPPLDLSAARHFGNAPVNTFCTPLAGLWNLFRI